MSLADYACADEAAHVFVYHADCLKFLRSLPDNWTHAIITDPPYGLADHAPDKIAQAITAWATGDRERVPSGKGFMGRAWDAFVPPPAVWDECLRVLKPGGHLAVFAGSRTVDLMGLSIRLAGFEMRDGIAAWLYGSGFPKSLDVGKAIDKAAGAEREVVGTRRSEGGRTTAPGGEGREGFQGATEHAATVAITAPATDAAREWQGWGTALKPAHEPILLARKPLSGTVATTVLAHRTGAINIDATRVAHASEADLAESVKKNQHTNYANPGSNRDSYSGSMPERTDYDGSAGRWPTNVVLAHHPDCHDEGECAPGCQVAALDEQSGTTKSSSDPNRFKGAKKFTSTAYAQDAHTQQMTSGEAAIYADQGGASRFFPTFRYQAKAPKAERPIVDGPTCNCETVKPCQSPLRATTGSRSTDDTSWSTSTSGSDTTADPCRPDTTSTTATTTSSTTTRATSSSSRSSNTSASTAAARSETGSGGSPAGPAPGCSPSTASTSTSHPRDGRSTADAASATSPRSSSPSACGSCGAPWSTRGHVTVKPLGLMRWLVRLLVPGEVAYPDGGGTCGAVLDPFAGSGATLEAARLEGRRAVGVERDEHSVRLIRERLFPTPTAAPVAEPADPVLF